MLNPPEDYQKGILFFFVRLTMLPLYDTRPCNT